MTEFHSNEEIKIELELLEDQQKPTAYSGRKYPLEYLDSREFEILLYFIFKKDIDSGQFADKFDAAQLMKGTSERGRDIILQKQKKNIGVVQCKRYMELVSKPELIREIIKFILHYLQDKTLINDTSDFTYYFVALKGFTEPTLELLQNFNTLVLEESNLKIWTEVVIKDNELIKFKNFEEVESDLKDILSKIKIEPINGVDIIIKLKNSKEIVSVFFEIEKVASEQMLDEMFKKYVGFTNDEDLERLRQRLQDLPKENRMSLGFFSVFGYDENFYKLIAHDRDLIFQIADLKSNFNQKFIAYLKATIDKYNLIFISGLPNISPFTKQAIVPYLFNKYALRFQEVELGKVFSTIIKERSADAFIHKVSKMDDIKKHLLDTGEMVLKDDFSSFVGDGELLELKKELSHFIHKEFKSVEEMSERFDKDMEILNPIISKIEDHIIKIMPQNPTIIIENPNILDSQEAIEKLVKEANRFDKKD